MFARSYQFGIAFLVAGAGLWRTAAYGQQTEPPPVPQGVEVQARGPVHEAFASLTAEAEPTKPIPKKPPEPLNEMPPEDKPAGDAVWIGGYWAWDDERSDFLWVSGTWRTLPPGRTWVAGYWRDDAANWRGSPASGPSAERRRGVSRRDLPGPAARAARGCRARRSRRLSEAFFVPGHWVWDGDRVRAGRPATGPRRAGLRLGQRSLPLDPERLHLRGRLLGPRRQPPRYSVRAGRSFGPASSRSATSTRRTTPCATRSSSMHCSCGRATATTISAITTARSTATTASRPVSSTAAAGTTPSSCTKAGSGAATRPG